MLGHLRPSSRVLVTVLAALALSCAAGDEPTGGGGSGGRTLTGASGPGGAGGEVTTGAGGAGGAAGAETGGAGGAGGSLSGNVELCVLNEGGPADPCQMPEELDFGVVSSGTIEKRFFRVDNQTPSDVLFKSASVTSGQFAVQAVRFEQDPGDPNNFLRVDVDLPVTRASTQSLWFEVAYTASGANGPLPTLDVVVKMNVDNNPVADMHVPIVGSESGCPSGQGACDADPANGCETNTNTSNDHCGQCNNPCDPMGGTGQCVGGVCTLSGCDPYQADCDMDASTGCEISLLNDAQHCGSCLNDCSKANTVTACSAGNCAIVTCQNNYGDCNLSPADGCETNLGNTLAHCGGCNLACDLANAAESCVPSMQTGLGVCTLGACNAGFKNCDLDPMTGCEVNTTNDVNNCGNCFSPCAFDHAAESCVNSMCQMGMCDQNYANCNGFAADGCEVDTQNDKDHCGGCATDCDLVFPGSSVTCSGGACNFGGCLPNFYNIDGNTANGCEYACTFQSATDLPDNSFVDTNCDGVDGNAADAIFVATSGSDGNPGTRAAPKLTINGGIAQALADNKHQILVSDGSYGGRVTLSNGISLYGGYSATNNWARSTLYVSTITSTLISGGRMSAVEGNNITTATTVDRFTITTGNTASAGVSNYGVYCNACTALTLKNSSVSAGTAGPGSPGGNGSNGAAGNAGSPGGAGSCDGSTQGPGGGGGSSSCGRTGGAGGLGGSESGGSGATGGTGLFSILGGTGGGAGDPGGDGNNGNPGTAGTVGSNGAAGSGGSVVGGFWQSGNGGTGGTGTHGNGGGGGGGGGGQDCFFCNNGTGNGGGGGGGGGCGATGASGGTGAGGSFGVFLVNSTGVVLTNNTIASSNGGTGGASGTAGTGGNGGGSGAGNSFCSNEIGVGGNGGVGGKGGDGGPGGGGAGGPSYAVYRSGTTVSTAGNTLSNGSGGAGGPSAGNPGTMGASGLVF